MEKNIPIIEVEIGKGDDLKKVKIYQWMTQEEEDTLQHIVLGDNKFTQDEFQQGVQVKLGMKEMSESNKFVMQTMCVTPWEEVNQWRPKLREELLNKINELREKN